MKLLVPKTNGKTTVSFRVSEEVSDRLAKARKQAELHGFSLPFSEHLAEQLERYVSSAEKELAALPTKSQPIANKS